MTLILFLLLFPLVPAVVLAVVRHDVVRGIIVRSSAALIAAAAIAAAWFHLGRPEQFDLGEQLAHQVSISLYAVEMLVALAMLFFCFKWGTRQWWIPALVLAQAGIVTWVEFFSPRSLVPTQIYIDDFSVIMVLIIGVIGSLICIYAVDYMRDHHHHHPEQADKRRSFFFVLFFFLSGMFGIVLCNHLSWIFLGWEITTLSSFLLIGYTRTPEATGNAFRALGLNSLGGLGFALALLWLVQWAPAAVDGGRTLALDQVLASGGNWGALALVPAILIGFAGLAKSAQMPFSSWLLGAMVAPTPVSALLHSSTMVKAGVFVLVKFAPLYMGSLAGYLLAGVGGVTFLMTSLIACTQSNAKRVLAYSTIANLGLVVMCAGVGTEAAVWAAVMLIVFHAVAKALLFLAVGSTEHQIGSRDIEDMDGLVASRPFLAWVMVVGILGMFLAPFGMLISKWKCLEALMTVGTFPPLMAVLLAFGSAPTIFFWSKWMGKLLCVSKDKVEAMHLGGGERLVLLLLAVLTVAASGLFPVLAHYAVDPWLKGIIPAYGHGVPIDAVTLGIMLLLLGTMLILPLLYAVSPKAGLLSKRYLAGANIDGSAVFRGSLGATPTAVGASYYLTGFLDETRLSRQAIAITSAVLVAMFIVIAYFGYSVT